MKQANGEEAPTCYYCDKNSGFNRLAYEQHMHKVVKVGLGGGGIRKTYHRERIMVPRCIGCHKSHNTVVRYVLLGFLVGFAIGAVIAWLLPARGPRAITTLGIIGGAMFAFLSNVFLYGTRGFKRAKNTRHHPPIKELLDQGYVFGRSP